jgi:hypothetical protein
LHFKHRGQYQVCRLLFPAFCIRFEGFSHEFYSRPTGDFCKDVSKLGLTKVEVRLDCASLLESMVEQARLVTFRAVARATSSVVSPNRIHATSLSKPSATTLAGPFTSVLSLSEEATAGSPTLQKARTSALRLNTILEGKAPTPHGGEDTLSPLLHKSFARKEFIRYMGPRCCFQRSQPFSQATVHGK